jgi:hypothetical protein
MLEYLERAAEEREARAPAAQADDSKPAPCEPADAVVEAAPTAEELSPLVEPELNADPVDDPEWSVGPELIEEPLEGVSEPPLLEVDLSRPVSDLEDGLWDDVDLGDDDEPLLVLTGTIDLDAFIRELENAEPMAATAALRLEEKAPRESPFRWGTQPWPRLEGTEATDPTVAEFVAALEAVPAAVDEPVVKLEPADREPPAGDELWTALPPRLHRIWPPMDSPTIRATVPDAARPLQDEWGFFDPEQCGFSAVLARLEQVTEKRAQKPSNARLRT